MVVTNPTHFAVALRYDSDKDGVPMVVAKGMDRIARRIIDVAHSARVPVLQNPPLARGLYFQIDVDGYITEDFIEPVAKVIRWAWAVQPEDDNYNFTNGG